ncbi:unnamed protein product [Rhizophagus irregularis]|nr:unnamed protein product [Rhizophagus irregularis]CAB5391901.1 unnamed protein product [Rhizophagus irregularis]
MDFWLDRLDPVVWKLVETYKGEIDEKFWATIASRQQYGSGYNGDIDGWMMAFFPYAKDGKKVTYNSLIPSDIPTGRVEVPFTTDTGFYLKLVAGFLGAQQYALENSNELVVSPVIGWFVIDDKTADEGKTKDK